jgi:hypothetical protein
MYVDQLERNNVCPLRAGGWSRDIANAERATGPRVMTR